MKYIRDTLFYIQYNSSITEETWKQIKNKFKSLNIDKTEYNYASWDSLDDFKLAGYIRTKTNTADFVAAYWAIDNNNQGIQTELTVEEFLNINTEPEYELY